ncbi:MAG: glycosyltransferase family 2 protein [Chroococcidiopsidaceae cyanobacterium CP_BM_ER_R8_30]|nr:glycosyltransferase family 2 protein [Chroococcidiopsidaceae cyanobacterium CP_BM_ER_R8_30]
MRIHSISLVKNESDIIEQVLKAALTWSDFIYVYDNGSTDGTWEKVVNLAKDHRQIVPYKQESKPMRDQIRSEAFNRYRSNSSNGDWWCRLDADEIYIDNPKRFLAEIPQKYELVWSASFQYYFTDKDLVLYNQEPSLYADDVPVEKKCRFYINNWSEIRFFRYKEDLIWTKNAWPDELYIHYPERIRLKHFQYRSPQQIQKRLNNRKNLEIFEHEKLANWETSVLDPSLNWKLSVNANNFAKCWEERIFDSSKLLYDVYDGKYTITEELLPKIPNQPLRTFIKRSLKRLKM